MLDRLIIPIRDFYRRLIGKLFNYRYQVSFSQCGEDVIVDSVFVSLGIKKPSYLDIGAHHPTMFSNTFHFYQKGSTGVCVEPDPVLYRRIKKFRPLDTCLNVGLSDSSNSSAKFYVMNNPTLNTFSEEEAQRYNKDGIHHIDKTIEIPLLTVNEIIEKHFSGKSPDFVSLDIEGWEMKILNSYDFKRFKPVIFCIETLTYSKPGEEKKIDEIIDFMKNQGYILYADTYINSIFVDKKLWDSRKPC